jgi:hypothetical protein
MTSDLNEVIRERDSPHQCGDTWAILPHNGAHGDKVFATSYESAIREAQFSW